MEADFIWTNIYLKCKTKLKLAFEPEKIKLHF